MISESNFLKASIRHQVGDLEKAKFSMNEPVTKLAKSALSGMALLWDHALETTDPYNGWRFRNGRLKKSGAKVNRDKVKNALLGIRHYSPDYSFFVDMADHRARSLVTDEEEAAPVFCFNRPASKPEGKILWPLAGYHDLGDTGFLGSDDIRDIPWSKKESKICWRGSAGGWARLGKYGRGRMIRMHALLNKNARDEISDADTERALMTIDRHRFISNGFNHPHHDVGYTQFGLHDFDSFPMIGWLKKDRLSLLDQTKSKYLAVLPGADIGSNYYWVLNSSSLGFVMETDYESFASIHFKPWIHYVPVRADLGDLERNFDWCENHPKECQEMVEKANSVCKLLANKSLRDQILKGVVDEVGRHLK